LLVKDRLILIVVASATLFMVYLSMYLVWTPVGRARILGTQGRYFIPVFIVLWMGIGNIKPLIAKRKLTLFIGVLSVIILGISAGIICRRYYYKPTLERRTFSCDAESISPDGEKFLSHGFQFGNAATRSTDMSRSGHYSSKLNSGNPYTFTFRLRNLRYGEKITVSVWRRGKAGSIILSGKTSEEMYVGQSKPDSADHAGWERLRQSLTVADNPESREAVVYIYYDGTDSAYFDDFKIEYFKKRF
jgi:hypothetical protein